jgi:hypothetical protein
MASAQIHPIETTDTKEPVMDPPTVYTANPTDTVIDPPTVYTANDVAKHGKQV